MAFTTPGSEETPDTSSSKTHLFDSGWSINIDIMLEQRPNTTNGTLLLRKTDSKIFDEYKNSFQEDLFMPGFQQPRGGNFEPRPMLADPMLNLEHSSTVLCRRITVLVGENEIPVALPMIYLTKYSALFRAAFDGQRRFIEGVTKEIRLPEENPRDFLLLARFLIQAPASLKEIQHHHWPYLCEPKDQCTWCDDEYLNTTQTPLHFRFCAMVERLGFTFPEEMYWSMLSNAAEGSPTLVQPATVEWAMQNSLEGGYFRRYVAKLLATILKDGQTAFETYEAVLSKYPDMCLTMLKEGFSLARPAFYECVPEQRAWTYHRRTAMKQSVPSSP